MKERSEKMKEKSEKMKERAAEKATGK